MKLSRAKIVNSVFLLLAVIVPVTALLFTFNYLREKSQLDDRLIRIKFSDATSIVPEKTRIVFKGIPVGLVKSVKLAEDHRNALVTALVEENMLPLLKQASSFRLVSAEVTWNGFSGLDTLLSGAYIQFSPGDGVLVRDFLGVLPSTASQEVKYNLYKLETSHAESLGVNDSIFHRGIKVGHVQNSKLSYSGNSVVLDIAIYSSYAYLIRNNTVFWKKQGIKADLGLFGSDIKVNSLDTLVKGGVEFATPTDFAERARYGHKFNLANDEPKTFFKTPDDWSPVLRTRNAKPKIQLSDTEVQENKNDHKISKSEAAVKELSYAK